MAGRAIESAASLEEKRRPIGKTREVVSERETTVTITISVKPGGDMHD